MASKRLAGKNNMIDDIRDPPKGPKYEESPGTISFRGASTNKTKPADDKIFCNVVNEGFLSANLPPRAYPIDRAKRIIPMILVQT